MSRGKINPRYLFAMISHEHVKRTTDSSSKQDGGTEDVNPFYNHIFHEQISGLECLLAILMNNLGKTMSLSSAESAYF